MTEQRTYDLSECAPPVDAVIGFFRALLAAFRTDGQSGTRPAALADDATEQRLAAGGAKVVRVGSAACAVVQGCLGLRNEILGTRGWEHRLETVGLAGGGVPLLAAYRDRDEAYLSGKVYRKETVLKLRGDASSLQAAGRLWRETTGQSLPEPLQE